MFNKKYMDRANLIFKVDILGKNNESFCFSIHLLKINMQNFIQSKKTLFLRLATGFESTKYLKKNRR